MHKKRNIIIAIFGLLLLAGAAFIINVFLIKPGKIIISLPYSSDSPTKSILPMGETIDHPDSPNGHPGIDFQWSKPTEILASADGKITDIEESSEYGRIWNITQKSGEYAIRYTELASVKEGLKEGAQVKKGEVIGMSKMFFDGHSSMHWEFRPAFMGKDRLCPLTYFDENSLERITKEWDGGKRASTEEIGGKFPHICSGGYHGKDE